MCGRVWCASKGRPESEFSRSGRPSSPSTFDYDIDEMVMVVSGVQLKLLTSYVTVFWILRINVWVLTNFALDGYPNDCPMGRSTFQSSPIVFSPFQKYCHTTLAGLMGCF